MVYIALNQHITFPKLVVTFTPVASTLVHTTVRRYLKPLVVVTASRATVYNNSL
ncbi:hypothetical protein N9913_02425 [Porticoccaceae bacterium]|nr:hypothetical protein [Porticoccaceae bacterium]